MPASLVLSNYIMSQFSVGAVEFVRETGIDFFRIKKALLKEFASFCINDEKVSLNFFENLICTDRNKGFELTYQVASLRHRHKASIRVLCTYEDSCVDSVGGVWRAAGICESEIHEMFGVNFTGNERIENGKHLFLTQNWQGFPLRKDYVSTAN